MLIYGTGKSNRRRSDNNVSCTVMSAYGCLSLGKLEEKGSDFEVCKDREAGGSVCQGRSCH